MRDAVDQLVELINKGCPNCPCDGCFSVRHCDGCDLDLCVDCWAEHNEDAVSHAN